MDNNKMSKIQTLAKWIKWHWKVTMTATNYLIVSDSLTTCRVVFFSFMSFNYLCKYICREIDRYRDMNDYMTTLYLRDQPTFSTTVHDHHTPPLTIVHCSIINLVWSTLTWLTTMVMCTLRGVVVLLTSCSWNVFILTVNWTHLTNAGIWKLSILNILIFNCEWALTDCHNDWSSLHHSFVWDAMNPNHL